MRKSFRMMPVVVSVAACGSLLAAEFQSADYKEECLNRIAVLEKKYSELVAKVPADKYTWRPAEGVRSVSEVFLHVAGVNFAVTRVFGTPPPAGFDMRGFEKSTADKNRIVTQVGESFAHFRKAIEQLSPADGGKPVKMFGQDTTMRGAVWMALEHLSEHLGQSIAYARVNGVIPPWSE